MEKILIYGYGNPGRYDDGLGNEFVNKIENWIKENNITNIDVDSNYQLNIEDAEVISHYDKVIFVDASEEPIDDFYFSYVEASDAHIEFTMHAVSTSFVVDLCQKIYNKTPEVYLIHIKGYVWDFEEKITEEAMNNLNKAFDFITDKLINKVDLKSIAKKPLKLFTNN